MGLKKIIKKIVPISWWDSLHWLISLMGALIYRFPSHSLIVIGVTGTNGKSTVVELLHDVFESFGLNVASASTVFFRLKGESEENKLKMTMPGRIQLQGFLRRAVKKGCQYAVLEVTSEGLKQHRAAFINFDAAVITNLRPEHIESHGSFEKYRAAKTILFKRLRFTKNNLKKISVVNLDDPSVFYFLRHKANIKVGYGLFKENVRREISFNFIPESINFSPKGVNFVLEGADYYSPLLGDFNLYNVLAAVAVARAFEIPLPYIQAAIKKFRGVPGRLEVIQKEPFLVCVDYAHTPEALEGVYRLAKSFWVKNGSKLIAVFGSAGGGRDKWKRPEMGRLANRFCDGIILTDEDPYDEDPEEILKDISRGITKDHQKILDRRLAIRQALEMAKTGDAILITGKGAEKAIMTRFGRLDWDDRQVVKEELAKSKQE